MKFVVYSLAFIAVYSQVKTATANEPLEDAKQALQDLYDSTDENTEYLLVLQNVELDQYEHGAINALNLIENNFPDADQSPIVKKAHIDIRNLVRISRECISKAALDAKDTVAKQRKELKDGDDLKAVTIIRDRVRNRGASLPIEAETCKVGLVKALDEITEPIKKMYNK